MLLEFAGEWWWLTLAMGAALVAIYSDARYEEPSYDKQTEFFARYKPRFVTSRHAYEGTKYEYDILITFLFIAFAVMCQWIRKSSDFPPELLSPLAIAAYIISLDKVPYLKTVELWLRGTLHARAKIPEGVRHAIAEMRASEFRHDPSVIESERRRLCNTEEAPSNFDTQLGSNKALDIWLKMGCLLDSLSENKRSKLVNNLDFFEHHGAEFEDIKANHASLAVRLHRYLKSQRSRWPEQEEPELLRELRNHNDRLLTFIACFVRSSVDTDVESGDILRRLGFVSAFRPEPARNMSEMLLWLLISMTVPLLAVLTLTPVAKKLANGGLPQLPDFPRTAVWFLVSATVYLVAMSVPLGIRAAKVKDHQWFELNDTEKRRPWIKYCGPMFWGAISGGAALMAIALSGLAPALGKCPSLSDAAQLTEALRCSSLQAIPWVLAYLGAAFAALWVSDTADMSDSASTPLGKFIRQSVAGGLGIAVLACIAIFLHKASASSGSPSFVIILIYVPFQVFLLTGAMLFFLQLYKYASDQTRHIVGKYVRALSAHGHEFCLLLESDGNASCFQVKEKQVSAANAICRGHWLHFPEGAIIRWENQGGANAALGGDAGLILGTDNAVVYQAFKECIAGDPIYAAQLHVRALPASSGAAVHHS